METERRRVMAWVQKFEAQSFTDNERRYTVSVDDNGKWGCSCKGWIFKYRKQGLDCQHIIEKKAEVGWRDDDISAIIRLKAQLIDRYQKQGKTEAEITRRLTR
jgi:hypothetical protein